MIDGCEVMPTDCNANHLYRVKMAGMPSPLLWKTPRAGKAARQAIRAVAMASFRDGEIITCLGWWARLRADPISRCRRCRVPNTAMPPRDDREPEPTADRDPSMYPRSQQPLFFDVHLTRSAVKMDVIMVFHHSESVHYCTATSRWVACLGWEVHSANHHDVKRETVQNFYVHTHL